MKRSLLLFLIFTAMLLTLSCKEDKQRTSGTNSVTDAVKEEPTVTLAVEDDHETNDQTSIEPYDIIEASYEKAGISIKYPKLTGLKDTIKQNKINQLIEQDAMRNIEDYRAEGAALEVGYEISWIGENLLSIKFVAYSNYPGAAHPNHSFYSTNIAIDAASRVLLKDAVNLSTEFVADFITGSVYTAPHEDTSQELSDMLESDISSLTPEGLMMADDAGVYTPYYSYYSETSLGIGIEVPFAAGGYALYEIPYQDIISYLNADNLIWKDFPEVLAQSDEVKKDATDNKDEAAVKEGDHFLPIVVGELVLGGYDGENWVELKETLPRFQGGETYQLFLDQEYVGTAVGKTPELDVDFQTFYMLEMDETDIDYNIAIGSDTELNSVIPRKAENSYYEEVVLNYFKELGHPEYKLGYLEGYSYDFDHDGEEEDIICAWQFQDQFFYEVPAKGCYSYVLYQDSGSMKVIWEANRGVASDYSAEFLNINEGDEIIVTSRPEFMSAIDITGDGACEIILYETGYEYWSYTVYELQGDNFIRVLVEGISV